MIRPVRCVLRATLLLATIAANTRADEPIRRADVALALMRFERAFKPGALDPETLARVNRSFDQATLAYFAGDGRRTLRALDALTLELLGRKEDARARAAIRLRVRVDPPRCAAGSAASVRVTPLYPLDPEPTGIRVSLTSDAPGFEPLELDAAGGPAAPIAAAALAAPGHHALALDLGDGLTLEAGAWSVLGRDAEAERTELARRLGALAPGRALDCARARVDLLRSAPDEEETGQVLLDPVELARDLEAEVSALESGRDPYRGRPGEQWRALTIAGKAVPYRVLAPAQALAAGRPLPLLVAFHGFKGDENMFRWAYGGGRLLDLAAARGWLVVTPRTEPFMRGPEAFDALVDALATDYPVDRARLYVLGHSMGSQAVSIVLGKRAEQVTGAVLFSGGGGSDPRLLSIRGALDPMGGFGGRAAAGRVVEGYGHTLVVGPRLEEALDFLGACAPRRTYY